MDHLSRSVESIERITGIRPVGLRSPSFDATGTTIQLAADAGLLYDSSLMADDEPYELLLDGCPTGLVEVPVDWIRDDATFLSMDRWSPIRPVGDPEAVIRSWAAEYDAAEEEGGLFQLTVHPDLIGHRSRIAALRTICQTIKTSTSVWAATHADVASYCRAGTGR